MNNRGEQSTILVVCTGNVCRSPLAQALLQSVVTPLNRDLSVQSAGTGALIGGEIPNEIREQARLWHLNLDTHAPTQISTTDIERAALILTAERYHRAEIVGLVPSTSRKVFTLKQLARITENMLLGAEQAVVESLRSDTFSALIDEVADHRALTPPPEQVDDDDIADPYRRSQHEYDLSAADIRVAVETIARFLSVTDSEA